MTVFTVFSTSLSADKWHLPVCFSGVVHAATMESALSSFTTGKHMYHTRFCSQSNSPSDQSPSSIPKLFVPNRTYTYIVGRDTDKLSNVAHNVSASNTVAYRLYVPPQHQDTLQVQSGLPFVPVQFEPVVRLEAWCIKSAPSNTSNVGI